MSTDPKQKNPGSKSWAIRNREVITVVILNPEKVISNPIVA
jgi:hypothetical protein